MVSTTPNTAALDPVTCMAASMKSVDTTPERKLTRTGVPRPRWKWPKKPPKNEPSAAAIACIRSEMIIHAAPWLIRMNTKHIAAIVVSVSAAPPYTVKTVPTASSRPPMPVMSSLGTTTRIAMIGMR